MTQLETKQSNNNLNIFAHIRKINDIKKQAGGLNDLFFEYAEPHITFLGDLLCISQIGAALFAGLAYMYRGNVILLSTLADYFDISCIEIIQYMDELEVLADKDLILIHKNDYNTDLYPPVHMEKIYFEFRLETIDLLRQGHYRDLVSTKNLSIDKFFLQLEKLCEDRVQKKQTMEKTLKVMRNLLSDNGHLAFVQKINKLGLPDHETLVLLRFFHYTVTMDEPDMTFRHLAGLYDHASDFMLYKRQFKNGQYMLITKGLIENSFDYGLGNTESFCLTDKTKEEFLVEIDLPVSKPTLNGVKSADSITEKKLFYPEKTQQAIAELTTLLQPQNFDSIKKRLRENGMRTGFACLFSGGPGTGKTETAYQIARLCGRDIMRVNIASIKSKWFGESEKQIKQIFNTYRAFAKKYAIAPILLFNEADAIISKRQLLEDDNNGPRQTENTMQNIILQELEDLDGILFATTNLTENMDAAFERRFLYKIEFENPKAQTRKEIWNSLIPGLSDDDAWSLASRFELSGGEIENISRKTTVHRVLHGNEPALEDMVRFCLAEGAEKQTERRIGFMVSTY